MLIFLYALLVSAPPLSENVAACAPQQVALPIDRPEAPPYAMRCVDTGEIYPLQLDNNRRGWWLPDSDSLSERIPHYELVDGPKAEAAHEKAAKVIAEQSDGRLIIRFGDQPILHYHVDVAQPPAKLDPIYARSGFIHPLFSPKGSALTSDFPPDHAHQHAVFAAWVKTTWDGRQVDFWNQHRRQGTVEHVELLSTTTGPVWGGFRVRLRHVALVDDQRLPVLEEIWEVRAYACTDVLMIDVTSEQRAVSDKPLAVEKYHYGGFAFRGRDNWHLRHGKQASDFLTSDGLNRTAGNNKPARWVALSGSVGDTTAGVAILSHSSNRNYPEPVRLHPEMPYFCFAPCVTNGFTITADQPHRFRYRLLTFEGKPDVKLTEAHAKAYLAMQ